MGEGQWRGSWDGLGAEAKCVGLMLQDGALVRSGG